MADEKKITQRNKFYNKGMVLSIPLVDIPEGSYAFLKNIRIDQDGVMTSRPSLSSYIALDPATSDLVHSIKRINSADGLTHLRVTGAGTKVYAGGIASLVEVDDGYSGKPLTFVDFRPEASVNSFCYIADELRMRKIAIDGTDSEFGIAAPLNAGRVVVDRPLRKIIDEMGDSSVTHWAPTGSAGAITSVAKVNTVIDHIILDDTTPGFASIVPHDTLDIHVGEIIKIGTETERIIEEIKRNNIPTNSSISAINYDVGVTGLCVITPTITSFAWEKDSIIFINGTEYVRIQEILHSVTGDTSFRCTTLGSFGVGQSLEGVAAFRTYIEVAHVAGETITNKALASTIGGAGVSTLTGSIVEDFVSLSDRALNPDDYVYIALKMSDPSVLIEIQFQLDIDADMNDFTQNYLLYAITPNNFQGTQAQTQSFITTEQQIAQIHQIQNLYNHVIGSGGMGPDNYIYQQSPEVFFEQFQQLQAPDVPNTPDSSLSLGESQWHIFKIPFSSFLRIGSDPNVGFKDVKKVRFSFNLTGASDVSIDSIWVGGGYEISGIREGFLDLNYVYRYKDPDTKEVSNWSPPLRNNVTFRRARLLLSSDPSTNPRATYVEWARIGSTINDFRVLGEIPQANSPFIDEFSDTIVAQNNRASFNSWQPFVITDTPKRGKCNVEGTILSVAGDALDTRYARGTVIIIDGFTNFFYTSPTKLGQIVELEYSMPFKSNVDYYIPQPTIVGYPFPIISGSFGEGTGGLYVFGLGDPINPGTLYWLDGNSASLQNQGNFLEITSPSEPLLNIVFYDSYAFVWTNKRSFQVLPQQDTATGQIYFQAKENEGVRGLYSRYAIMSTEYGVCYLTDDGIDVVQGAGAAKSLTDGVLHTLFPHNGIPPSSLTLTNGITLAPPDFTLLDDLRLYYVNSLLYFRFIDTNGDSACLVYDFRRGVWISYDRYITDIGCVYAEEDKGQYSELFGLKGYVAKAGIAAPVENDLESICLERSMDFGSQRWYKRFEDLYINSFAGSGYTIQPRFNYNEIIGTLINKTANFTKLGTVHSLEAYEGFDVSLEYNFTLGAGVKLYEDSVNATLLGELLTDSTSGFDDAGVPLKDKLFQGIILEANTFGQDKILNFISDDNISLGSITINHTGQQIRSYSFDLPKIAHAVSFSSDDGVKWILFKNETSQGCRYVFDLEPEKAKVWEGEFSIEDIAGFHLFKKVFLSYRADNDVSLILTGDDGIPKAPIIFPTTGGAIEKNFNWIPPTKTKIIKYRFESITEFRIYKNHCELFVRGFDSENPWSIRMPFGDVTNQTEIRI